MILFECTTILPLREEIVTLLKNKGKETIAKFDDLNFYEKMKSQINNDFLKQLEIEITAIKEEKSDNFSELYFNLVIT